MKTLAIISLTLLVLFSSCFAGINSPSLKIKSDEIFEEIQNYLQPGATINEKRVYPNILSEEEILIKAADYALEIGALDLSNSIYEENPSLINAKIETPILLHQPDGKPSSYMLTAVEKDGSLLMYSLVRPNEDAKADDSFETARATVIPDAKIHYLTKRETISLINDRFPDGNISEPIAIRGLILEDSPHTDTILFWYFTKSGVERSIDSIKEEYIIDATILGYTNSSLMASGRSIVLQNDQGTPYLKGSRIAKLETPLNIDKKVEVYRTLGNSSGDSSFQQPVGKIKFIPLPLR
jgi:hypothetical protein